MDRQVLTTGTRAVLALCDRAGIRREELLGLAGLPATALESPNGWVSLNTVEAIWKAAADLLGDPHVGLHAALSIPLGAYGVVDHLAANAPTFGDGVQRIARYIRLLARSIFLEIRVLPEGRRCLELILPGAGRPIIVQYAEFVFGLIVSRFRPVTAKPCVPLEVRLAGPSPERHETAVDVFGAPVRYDQPRHEMVFSEEVWAEPVIGSDSTLSEVLERHAADLLRGMPEATDVVRRVREAVATSLREGEPTLQVVAANQNTSVRTLQRRLAEEGVTFRSVVDEVRQELAQGMLADGRLTIAEMAYLLGYSEPSAFHRAYKRWTGKTPEEYRRSHR